MTTDCPTTHPKTPAYNMLAGKFQQIYHLQHLESIADWDGSVNMPPQGQAARAAALAELAGVIHRLRIAPDAVELITRAAAEPLSDLQQANLREMRQIWRMANALPDALVQRRQLVTAACEHAWREQRPRNDWSGFLERFRDVLSLAREEAGRLADTLGVGPYEALMQRYEPGATCAELDRLFGAVRLWLPGLIAQVVARQAGQPVLDAHGPFPEAVQRALCEQVMRRLQFDFTAGRLDVSTHPFCGGVAEDVRMTTRFRRDGFLESLYSAIHETGHGRYEQNRPREWLGQPIAESRSMAIHESQSLSFEMQLGRHPGFAEALSPLLREAFDSQPAFAPDNLWRLLTRVKPGRIRVEADEVTYPAHIIMRYEIERLLIEKEIEAEDIPEIWNARMAELLDLDTRGDFKDGPMQDVHWPLGLFGYFPCYSLGAMYAAQWFAAMRRQRADLDDCIIRGDWAVIFDWLRDHVWRAASRYDTETLVVRATGEALNPDHFRAHLQSRYLA